LIKVAVLRVEGGRPKVEARRPLRRLLY